MTTLLRMALLMTSVSSVSMIGDQIESGRNHNNGAAAGHGRHAPDQPLQGQQGVPRVLKADFDLFQELHSYRRPQSKSGGWI